MELDLKNTYKDFSKHEKEDRRMLLNQIKTNINVYENRRAVNTQFIFVIVSISIAFFSLLISSNINGWTLYSNIILICIIILFFLILIISDNRINEKTIKNLDEIYSKIGKEHFKYLDKK
ncbi:MAG: hypothetical protein KAU20_01025 [Nanoarchaeota archaeon]|nr:hypothetical protein [Nanoarchaeota archaeon]